MTRAGKAESEEDEMAQTVRKLFEEWIRPMIVPLLFVTVAGVRVIDKVDRNERTIQELRERFDRTSSCGPGGFLDPSIHGSVDQHLEQWHREVFGVRGWRELQSAHSDGNGR